MKLDPETGRPAGPQIPPDHRQNGLGATHPAPQARSSANAPASVLPSGPKESEALAELFRNFGELRKSVAIYAAAHLDIARATLRKKLTQLALLALGFIGIAGAVVIASWLALSGAAQGMGALFGARPWIGTLLTGLIALLGVGAGLWGVIAVRAESARKETVEKYVSNPTDRSKPPERRHDEEN